jgi:hypothetical protein
MTYNDIEHTQEAATAAVLEAIKAKQPVTFDNLLASVHEYNPALRSAILADVLTKLIVGKAVQLTASSQTSSSSFLPLSFITTATK